ncbi:dTDP-4-dehydrorhamnose 3,5-epimerase family protein [Terrabacter sp. C0L_2]|uniref:dTDP-4-dehydrorhamnose 3,5-epimerase family protein n=1 Tax=Terrabacter sp. C0L_2 TaxID=3108389 RepID=UPI002ED55ECB|nr:dTDP-4-dehydrorhamnose 3,5-epimerase [Terrabacter sp. C0L_2]
MDIRPLRIAGAFEITPRQFPDDRGVFAEGFRVDHLAEAIGHEMQVRQTNISVSSAGALRGIHFADVPPSQAKYVTATSGVFVDYVVDLRVGSPTFGEWDSVVLDTVDRRAVYLSEGLGHALACIEDGTAVYLCSEVFNPTGERGITPLDPRIALKLPEGFEPILSPKDAAAPTLDEAEASGVLPTLESCLAHTRSLAGERR